MSAVQVFIRQRGNAKCFPMTVELNPEDTVGSVLERIAEKTNLKSRLMRVVFNGKRLENELRINDLNLGRQTGLTVTIAEQEAEKPKTPAVDPDLRDFVVVDPTAQKPPAAKKTFSTFFVFCKKCDQLNSGKLRANCSCCGSNAIAFLDEPSSWDDVMGTDKIRVNCEACERETTARFTFKCSTCSTESPALSCIKPNKHDRECSICGEVEPLLFSLKCGHVSCVPCVSAYMEQILAQWLFVYRADVGFTMSCVLVDCSNYIEDCHHFYLMGRENYEKFQRMSAEKFLSFQSGSQYCPHCAAGFTVEMEEKEDANTEVLCPECNRLFCTRCKDTKCTCEQLNKTIEAIKAISKPCPRCKTPIERAGGCAHITCTCCGFSFCFICLLEFSVDCQMEHWFD
ncbi:Ubiquitin-like domain-containing protein [Aphelenchoides fujianensis]|nr:Ubiquitin-like domain-containing protein [Aphelenchoides fujianensis]